MCAGDDRNCPQFELHHQKLLDDLDAERRAFLKSAFVATGGAAALGATGGSLMSPAVAKVPRRGPASQPITTFRRQPTRFTGAISASCSSPSSRSIPVTT